MNRQAWHEFTLALRLASRQWRAGDLWLLLAASVLAVAITTLIAAFGDRMERGLVRKAADLLGADLVLAGSRPAADHVAMLAQQYRLRSTSAVDFTTMLATPDDSVQQSSVQQSSVESGSVEPGSVEQGNVVLVAVRAVADGYPLRGQLGVVSGAPDAVEQARARGPAPGEIWIEPRVADELGIARTAAVGRSVLVGNQALTVTALVTTEPDRAGTFAAFSPRVLMHRADLAATGVIQPGSRVRYRVLFAGAGPDIAALKTVLQAQLAVDEELLDLEGGSRRTASALTRALQFLSLASIFAVLLCGATLALVADRQARRLFDTVALLRTLGLARRVVWRLLVLDVVLVAVIAGSVGTVLGYLGQELLVGVLAPLLPVPLPAPGAAALAAGFGCAFIALPAFLLPPLARLAEVSPLRVLRRDLAPPSARTARQYLLGLGALALLLVLSASDRWLALALLGGVVTLVAVGVPLAAAALRALARRRARLALPLRLAADRLAAAPLRSGAQLVAFALIFTTLTVAVLLRNDLLHNWQQQVPADAPNLFAMNLLPHERDPFLSTLAANNIAPPVLYPVTPGRLLRIGGQPLAERVDPESGAGRSLDRDLILTAAATDPATVTAGTGFTAGSAPGQVSVEQKLAEDLALQIGEQLVFSIAGEEISATVSGFRRVEWDSFQPNFFMVLSPGTLADSPYTWLSSFHAVEPPALMRQLRAEFPALTVLEVGPLLARLAAFVGGLADGIELVALLLFAAALLLLLASVVTTLDERLGEAAMLRVLGARGRLLRQTLAAEFALLGAGSGLVAAATSELARWQLYTRLLELPWAPLPALLLLPVLGAALLALLGVLAARRSLQAGAAAVLRDG